ncbi:hypothetical protein CJ030_MR6G025632 [Morella rubra]|uniref:Uncharacterized protein n=1 Tax=Morella rubra TaxID=262757 RepID=A0A6A1VFV8_9ROSI|nr:hypothetical protein CJ030_MR6G025632 [Morella rubra]
MSAAMSFEIIKTHRFTNLLWSAGLLVGSAGLLVLVGVNGEFQAAVQFLIPVFVNILQIEYQSSSTSPFKAHGTIMSLFIVTVCVHVVAFMEISMAAPYTSYLPTARLICSISGVLASTLLVLILFPPFGWFILFLCAARISHELYGLQARPNGNATERESGSGARQEEVSVQAFNDSSIEHAGGGDVAHLAEASPQAFVGFSAPFLATVQFLIQVLVNILQVEYQSSSTSPFETHGTTMSLFIATVCLHVMALMEITKAAPYTSYLPTARLICSISGVLASTLLVLILFPPFGWFILFLCAARISHELYGPMMVIFDGISLEQQYGSLQQLFNDVVGGLQARLNGSSAERESGSDARQAEVSVQAFNDSSMEQAGSGGAHQAEASPQAFNGNSTEQEVGGDGNLV